MGRSRLAAEMGCEFGFERPLLILPRRIVREPLGNRGDDGFGIDDPVEILSLHEAVLPDERKRLDRKAPVVEAARLAEDQATEAVPDRGALERGARELDGLAWMPVHVVRFQHAERCEHPTEASVRLIGGRRDRQNVALRRRRCARHGALHEEARSNRHAGERNENERRLSGTLPGSEGTKDRQ